LATLGGTSFQEGSQPDQEMSDPKRKKAREKTQRKPKRKGGQSMMVAGGEEKGRCGDSGSKTSGFPALTQKKPPGTKNPHPQPKHPPHPNNPPTRHPKPKTPPSELIKKISSREREKKEKRYSGLLSTDKKGKTEEGGHKGGPYSTSQKEGK